MMSLLEDQWELEWPLTKQAIHRLYRRTAANWRFPVLKSGASGQGSGRRMSIASTCKHSALQAVPSDSSFAMGVIDLQPAGAAPPSVQSTG